jgi:hypothetical protein
MTKLGRMTEDVVASLYIPQLPAIGFEHLDHLFTVHGGYYTHQTGIINTIPRYPKATSNDEWLTSRRVRL